jgi:hypothetical protein
MAKLFKILAASVGGGIVLGASIRLGEVIGSSAGKAFQQRLPGNGEGSVEAAARRTLSVRVSAPISGPIEGRLDRLEKRLDRVNGDRVGPVSEPAREWRNALAGVMARIDRQQADMEAIGRKISHITERTPNGINTESAEGIADALRREMQREMSEELDRRLAAVEENFQESVEAANRRMMDAMVTSIDTRIAPRISRLEADIAGQSGAVLELRECVLQSERSVQRLLDVLERVAIAPAGLGKVKLRSQMRAD